MGSLTVSRLTRSLLDVTGSLRGCMLWSSCELYITHKPVVYIYAHSMAGEEEDRQKLRDEIALEKFEKPFAELDSDEKMAVGGTIGGRKGGQTRKEEMEKEGTTEEGKLKAYSEMGKMGAKKGGYGNELAHDPDMKEKYTGDRHYGEKAFD